MNIFLLYLLLLKETITSFSGLSSLPIIRYEFVEMRQVLTEEELGAAVAAEAVIHQSQQGYMSLASVILLLAYPARLPDGSLSLLPRSP